MSFIFRGPTFVPGNPRYMVQRKKTPTTNDEHVTGYQVVDLLHKNDVFTIDFDNSAEVDTMEDKKC